MEKKCRGKQSQGEIYIYIIGFKKEETMSQGMQGMQL